MPYMSAREMLSGLPVKMAEGGAVQSVLDYITNNPSASVAAIATQVNNSGASVDAVADALGIDRAVAQEAYTTANTANQEYLASEQSILDQLADPLGYGGDPNYYNTPEWNAFAYSEILRADEDAQKNNTKRINVQGALDAGVAQSTIDRIFTTPTGSPAYAGPDPTATMRPDVQVFFDSVMADGEIDATERLVMQTAATDQGLSYDDILALGVNPNVLYNTAAAACPEGYTRNAAGDCEENVTVCGDGFILNPITGNCMPNNSIPNCGTGKKYNPTTDKCEEIFKEVDTDTGTGADSATGAEVYDPTDFGTDPTVFAGAIPGVPAVPGVPASAGVPAVPGVPAIPPVPAEESLDRTFRDSAPRAEIIDAYGGLVDFDYSPAASLISATGSGYNFTPPTVTSRPRSLMSGAQLGRYTGGRAAADLRQLTTGLGNGRTYSDYAGVLQNPGSYSGGLSKSQLYSRMRGLDYQRDAAAAVAAAVAETDKRANAPRGGIDAYLAANPDIAASYESQKGQLGGQSLDQFARNHYNMMGRAEMDAGKRGDFILVENTGGGTISVPDLGIDTFDFNEGEGEAGGLPNWNSAIQLGRAGGVRRQVFAQGGSVKKPQGFADGGTASANLKALDPTDSLFITEDTVEEVNPDNIQRDIPFMERDGVVRPTNQEASESRSMLENMLSGAVKIPESVGNYFVRPDEQGNPSMVGLRQVGSDIATMGGALVDAVKEDDSFLKSRSIAEIAPITGELISGADALKFSDMANEARASGDDSAAGLYEQLVTLSTAGAVPLVGIGARVGRRATIKAAEEAIKKGSVTEASKMLNDLDPSIKYEGMRDATVQRLKDKGIMSDEEFRVAELDGYAENPKFTYSIDDSGSNSSYITLKKTTEYDDEYGVLDFDEYTIRFSDHSLPRQYSFDRNMYNVSNDYLDETINGKSLEDAIDYVDRLVPATESAKMLDEVDAVNAPRLELPEIGRPVRASEYTPAEFKAITRNMYNHQADVTTPAEMVARAERIEPSFQTAIRNITDDLGLIKSETFGVKQVKSLENKLKRGYELGTVTDPIRTRILINTAQEADEVVDRITQIMPLQDRGVQQHTTSGYFDRKLNVMYTDANGEKLLGEIQITTPEMLEAVESTGHRLYEVERALTERYGAIIPTTHIRRFENMQRAQKELYQGVAERVDPSIVNSIQIKPKKDLVDTPTTPTHFKKGGAIERVYNEQTYI